MKKKAPSPIETPGPFTQAPAATDEKRQYGKRRSTKMGGIAKPAAKPNTSTWLWEAAFGWKHLRPAV